MGDPTSRMIDPFWLGVGKWLSTMRWKSPRRLLIVDDNPNDAELLGMNLTKAGRKFDIAGTAEEGLALSKANNYAIAFVDLNLPGMPGWELLKLLHLRYQKTRRIIVTGGDSISQIPIGIHFELICKPISFEATLDCLRLHT